MIIQQELSAEDALEKAWQTLDQRYWTAQRPSQQLMVKLLHGPIVSSDDPAELSTFASNCEAALFLKQRDTVSFASLDELIHSCLPPTLTLTIYKLCNLSYIVCYLCCSLQLNNLE